MIKKRNYLWLFLISLTFYSLISLIQKIPGYMDSSYYFATGQIIASGRGLSEPFLWNYLNDPQALANPIFSYWMPLPGLLASIPLILSGSAKFWVARIPFILLSSLIPLLCVFFTSKFTRRTFIVWLSAGFGLLSGYYLPYLTITETFAPYFILGAVFFVLSDALLEEIHIVKNQQWRLFFLGIVAGLMHLTRADGILWLFGAVLVAFMFERNKKNQKLILFWTYDSLLILVGYLLVMAGWFIRNLDIYHSLFVPGSNLSFWMTEYNDLFIYPANSLTWQRWLNGGVGAILVSRVQALGANAGSLIGVAGEIVLFPFIVVGFWQLRNRKSIQFSLIMLFLVFSLMSLVFPFAGARGGFFHSVSAFQILFCSVGACGFEKSIEWLARVRKWKVERSIPLLGSTVLVCIFIITSIAFGTKVFGINETQTGWNSEQSLFFGIESFLKNTENPNSNAIMVNDSPTYYVTTGRLAVQQTNCDIDLTKEVMKKFGVTYLVVGQDHTQPLEALYTKPGDQSGLILIGEIKGNFIYEYQY